MLLQVILDVVQFSLNHTFVDEVLLSLEVVVGALELLDLLQTSLDVLVDGAIYGV